MSDRDDRDRGDRKEKVTLGLKVARGVAALFAGSGKGIMAFTVVMGLIGGVAGLAIVDPGERGIHVRNGEVIGTLSNGAHLTVPLFDNVRTFNMRTQKYTVNKTRALTRDDINVKVSVAARWNIRDGKLKYIYKNVAVTQEALVDNAVEDAVLSSVKVSRNFTAEELASSEYKRQVRERAADELDDRGLELKTLTITNIEFPSSVEKKFREEQRSSAQVRIEQNKLEAEQTRAERKVLEAQTQRKQIQIKTSAITPEYIAYIRAQNIDKGDTVYFMGGGGVQPQLTGEINNGTMDVSPEVNVSDIAGSRNVSRNISVAEP